MNNEPKLRDTFFSASSNAKKGETPHPNDSGNQSLNEKPKQPSKKETLQGCGCLIALALAALMLLGYCTKRGAKTTDQESTEYKIAYLDSGSEIDRNSPLLSEYKRLLDDLSKRFEITQEDVGNMTYATVKNLKANHGIQTTTLAMLRAVHHVAMSGSGDLFGKGKSNYAYAVASVAAGMK